MRRTRRVVAAATQCRAPRSMSALKDTSSVCSTGRVDCGWARVAEVLGGQQSSTERLRVQQAA